MALEKRGKSVAYYRSARRDGKVQRTYVASGYDARLAAAIDAHRRLRERMDREVLRAEIANWSAACASLCEFILLTDLVAKASLLAAGYHRHHQGDWRRRRDRQKTR